jgi:cysteine desulfurase/selenocysteine lyase
VILEAYARLLGPRVRIVSLSHASNSLGTILPVELMTGMAKAAGARVLVDGAQSVSHFPVDVRRIGCDFYVFSGHKIFGPTGIGAVFMTREVQESLPPWQGGGNMIRDVTFAHTAYAGPPAKFEAGTPNIADAIGLAAALDYVTALGRERIAAYEHELLHYATDRLTSIDGLRIIGTAREKVGVLSFVLHGLDPVEIGKALDRAGLAVRAGHHCAQPSLRRYGLEATVRPSLAFYNTRGEIDRLADAITAIARGL